MSSAADVIVARFLYAIGYNTPRNEAVDLKLSDLRVSDKATIKLDGRSRAMTWNDLESMVRQIPHYPDGSFRIMASRAIEGESIGPFLYDGTRPDDPNDIVPHQDRRDLRGLRVFAAWLNNTDAKAANTLDTVVTAGGVRFIRHYLLDFGSALGSDGDAPKDPRLGHEYMMGTPGAGLMAFTDDDIRSIVEAARYSDKRAAYYIISTLAARRDKIGRIYFATVLPLDRFRVEHDELMFDDLAVQYGFHDPRTYVVRWSGFDNLQQKLTPIPAGESVHLPPKARESSIGSYFCAVIESRGEPDKRVSVYLRKERSGYKVVGLDRMRFASR
jgi:hypothetical protein